MKITCNRDRFMGAFQMAAAAAPSRSPKPVLENVKLDVTSDGVSLSATDLEISINVAATEVEIESQGEVILPKDKVGSILRESSDELLVIESDDRSTSIRGERMQFKLQTIDPAEFPALDAFADDAYHELSARLFREMIRRTIFATDAESSRYALGGILLEMHEDQVIAVGTDGRRLARMLGPATAVGGHSTQDNNVIVPSRSMQQIERCLGVVLGEDSEAVTRVAANEQGVSMKCGGVTVHSRLAEGRFPRWRDVLPNRPEARKIEMTVGPLQAAVRQAAIVTTEESRGVAFAFGDGLLTLSARAADAGESQVELPIGYDAAPVTIHLDPRFVLDFLRVLDPQRVATFEIQDAESAAVANTDDGFAYVIMPLAPDN